MGSCTFVCIRKCVRHVSVMVVQSLKSRCMQGERKGAREGAVRHDTPGAELCGVHKTKINGKRKKKEKKSEVWKTSI